MAITQTIRTRVWSKLREVAYPDSRFDYNFAEFIPDFVGREAAVKRIINLPAYQAANFIFIAPDNCLTELRERALRDRKTLLVSTYGIRRGFVLLSPETVPSGEERFASWLDGLEEYGQTITLTEIANRGKLDLLLTGASAVSTDGVRFGKGHGFFDLEWGMFSEIGIVNESTLIAAVVHDVQVVNDQLELGPTDVVVDYIATPSRIIEVARDHHRRPTGIQWGLLEEHMAESIPPLKDLQRVMTR
jgi:5-formyltetrahydrofolate cyclo-ligase